MIFELRCHLVVGTLQIAIINPGVTFTGDKTKQKTQANKIPFLSVNRDLVPCPG